MLRKKILSVLSLLLAVLLPSFGIAQEEAPLGLKVSESAIATGIENLTPQGASDTFPPTVAKLYAFSKITGAIEETSVKHLWYYGDKLMAEVRLPVKSTSWRTYSSKNILPIWTGQWRVDITAEDGIVLDTLHFTIE